MRDSWVDERPSISEPGTSGQDVNRQFPMQGEDKFHNSGFKVNEGLTLPIHAGIQWMTGSS